MLEYKRLFWALIAMAFLGVSYTSSHDVSHQLLLPATTIIICCGLSCFCFRNKLWGLIFFPILSVIICPLLIGGLDANEWRKNPEGQPFDTRTGAFIGDVHYTFIKVSEIAGYSQKAEEPKKVKLEKSDEHPNYSFGALCICAPFGIINIVLSGRKPEKEKRKRK